MHDDAETHNRLESMKRTSDVECSIRYSFTASPLDAHTFVLLTNHSRPVCQLHLSDDLMPSNPVVFTLNAEEQRNDMDKLFMIRRFIRALSIPALLSEHHTSCARHINLEPDCIEPL